MHKTINKITLFLVCFTTTVHTADLTFFKKCKNFYWNYYFKAETIKPSAEILIKNLLDQLHQKNLAYGTELIKNESLTALFTKNFLELKLNADILKVYSIRTDWVDQYRAQGIFMVKTDRAIWIDEEFFITELTEKQQQACITYLCLAAESKPIRWNSLMAVTTGAAALGFNLLLEKSFTKHIPYISQDQSQWGPYLANWTAYLTAVYAAQYANKKMLNCYQNNRIENLFKKYVSLGHSAQDLIEVFEKSDEMSGGDRYLKAINTLKAVQ
jgi:hypothetical protein